jgi:hypothetical protein
VREATIRDAAGQVAVRIIERQIVRQRPPSGSAPQSPAGS